MSDAMRPSLDYSGDHALQPATQHAQDLRLLELRLEHEAREAAKNRNLERTKVLVQYGLGALAVAAVSAAATLIAQQMAAHEKDIERSREDVRFAHENFWKAIELYADTERRAPVLRFLVAADTGQLGGWATAELERDEPLRTALEDARKQALQEVQAAAAELEAERSARAAAEREAREVEGRLAAIQKKQREAQEMIRRAEAARAQRTLDEQRQRAAALTAEQQAAEKALAKAKAEAAARRKSEEAARARRTEAAKEVKASVAPVPAEPQASFILPDTRLMQAIAANPELLEALRKPEPKAAAPQR